MQHKLNRIEVVDKLSTVLTGMRGSGASVRVDEPNEKNSTFLEMCYLLL